MLVTHLLLGRNAISDVGLKQLVATLSNGALPRMQKLSLEHNLIGPDGAIGRSDKMHLKGCDEIFTPGADWPVHDIGVCKIGAVICHDTRYPEATRILAAIARKHASGRAVSLLEGGYDLEVLAEASALHVRTLVDELG